MNTPKWLEDAIFYEIYPQSFYDTNNDGIGDLEGIREKLDYVKSLGCNAIWINPIFDSPMKDAGYDVRDYYKIAPRYGTMLDLKRLLNDAHKKGMHILLDLVPCHTSDQHKWFKESSKEKKNRYSKRYIWTNSAFEKPHNGSLTAVGGVAPRNGTYVISYFNTQPSLNYGFGEIDESWQDAIDSEASLDTQNAMVEVMDFYLNLGVDGFRVDMAACLCKNDPEERGTCHCWENMLGRIKAKYPESAFVSEWANPKRALKCGFDMDFYLDHGWSGGNGYHHLTRDIYFDENLGRRVNNSYFKFDSSKPITRFLDEYLDRLYNTKEDGYISFLTDNHDMIRIKNDYSIEEIKMIYAFLFTLPGVPFLYYGDEIGMNYLNVPTKEGGYHRTGSRTPMQWDNKLPNFGFSGALKRKLYLPVDSANDAPSVSSQENDPDSLLNYVRNLIKMRKENPSLGNKENLNILRRSDDDKLFIYERNEFIIITNPSNWGLNFSIDRNLNDYEKFFALGDGNFTDNYYINERSFVVLKRK